MKPYHCLVAGCCSTVAFSPMYIGVRPSKHTFESLDRGAQRKHEIADATVKTKHRKCRNLYDRNKKRVFHGATMLGTNEEDSEELEQLTWPFSSMQNSETEEGIKESDDYWILDDDFVELETPLYLEQFLGSQENADATKFIKNNTLSDTPSRPRLNYLTNDETAIMSSLLMENFTLAPASQIAYFYLHNSLGLSEDTMWKITLEYGSILGLTSLNLERKVNLLKRTMNLSKEDLQVILHKQPSVLQLNPDKNLGPTLSYLARSLGLSKDDLRSIVLAYPSILCYSLKNLEQKIEFFRETLGCSQDKARNLLVSTPQLLTLSVTSGLGLMAKYNMLRFDVELSESSIKEIIIANPRILACYGFESNLVPKLIGFFMVRLDMSATQVEKMLLNYPLLMDRSLEGHLQPFADYFCDQINFSPQELRTVVLKFPRILSYSLIKIKHVAGFLRYEVGLTGAQSKRILYQAPQVIGLNDETLRSKITFLQTSLDLSGEELRKILSGMPSVLKCSMEQNITPKVSYLFSELDNSLETLKRILVLQPTLLGYSLEKRIKPRLEQLKQRGIPLQKITIGITMTEPNFHAWLETESMSPQDKARMRWRKRRGLADHSAGFAASQRSEHTHGMRVHDKEARIISWTRPVE
jgi:hypothetical protein